MVTLLGFHGGTGLLSLLLLVVLQPHQSWALGASAATGYDATSAGSGSGRQGLGHAGMAWIPGLKVRGLVGAWCDALGFLAARSLLVLFCHPLLPYPRFPASIGYAKSPRPLSHIPLRAWVAYA